MSTGFSAVAVRLVDHSGQIEKVTEYHKGEGRLVVIPNDGTYLKIFRKGREVGSYSASSVISWKPTNRPFRTRKVVFVRRLVRIAPKNGSKPTAAAAASPVKATPASAAKAASKPTSRKR